MYAVAKISDPVRVHFHKPEADLPQVRELEFREIDDVSGGFVCGGVCVGIAIVGAVALLGGGIYVGWRAAHNTAG